MQMRLCLGLGLDRGLEAHRPLLVQLGLGHHVRKVGARREGRGRAPVRVRLEGLRLAQAVEEPPPLGPRRLP